MTFSVEEHIPGILTVLKVGSRSRPGTVHYVSIEYDEQGRVSAISCSCESGEIRQDCHHLRDLRDLMGKSEQEVLRHGNHESRGDPGGPVVEHPPEQ